MLDEGAGVIFKEQEFADLKFLVVLESICKRNWRERWSANLE